MHLSMKFDTRFKKPKLWNLAVLALLCVAAVAFLACGGAERNAAAICMVLDLFFLAALVLLVLTFFQQLQYNPYSYNTIYYTGFALFDLSVLVTHVVLTVRIVGDPSAIAWREILEILTGSAKNYMLLSFPFIVIFSTALCVSNISLIRHEGKRFVNLLGILLSFLMVGGALLLYAFDFSVRGSAREVMLWNLVLNLASAVYLYFECMLIGAIIADSIAARYEPEHDKDVIIILGCGIRKDGSPSPLLRGRIDRAIAFAEKQKETSGKEVIFVTSGGQGPDEVISESASMKRYLMEHGIPEKRIVEEDRSSSTFENMRYSKEKILAIKPDAKVAFSTTNYHVFRGGLYARRVKMRAQGMGSDTKWYFWPNASVREFIGLLTEHRLKQALIFGGMILLYSVLTVLIYR